MDLENFYTEEQVLGLLKIKLSTLSMRRYVGTDHPPYIPVGRTRLYPKDKFEQWLNERPIKFEVKRARAPRVCYAR